MRITATLMLAATAYSSTQLTVAAGLISSDFEQQQMRREVVAE